jgi:glutamyl-tRNA synthetase
MPTYHLAVVVDDYLMKITHAFRGEEWLPSAPVHILLWKYLFGLDHMPQWAHLPLILKPEGSGKLSKRDGERLGFPVFAMDWQDPKTQEQTIGFRERGFLPEAFVNLLAMLGWNNGTEQEIFSLDELIAQFSIDRVHKAGAKFDYEKAKWFNQQWIQKTDNEKLATLVKPFLDAAHIEVHEWAYLVKVIGSVKERCHLLPDFVMQSVFYFKAPETIDIASIQSKWNTDKQDFFTALANDYEKFISSNESLTESSNDFPKDAISLETHFKNLAAERPIKLGELLLAFRIMLVGGKFGPGVFEIVEAIELKDAIQRIRKSLSLLSTN